MDELELGILERTGDENVRELCMGIRCLQEEVRITANGKWVYEDPRHTIWKRANIVILRPGGRAGTAHVECKHAWFIHTTFEDYPRIDEWDPAWCWARIPDAG